VSDQTGNEPPPEAEELEREIDQLEEKIEMTLGGDNARRIRRLRRRAAEAEPDALFDTNEALTLHGIARRTDSYGFVLVLLAVLIWVFVPFAAAQRWATFPTLLVFFLTIIISMHTSLVRRRWLTTVIVVDSLCLVVGVAGGMADNDTVRAIANAGFGMLLFATALVILRRVLSHQMVTSRTLSGAVAAFLLVGLAFAAGAEAIVLLNPDAYTTPNGVTNFAAMLYFSFVTIATLGYGDIVPVTSFARTLATMEAVMGQIYLVTIVARLVSLLGVRRITTTVSAPAPADDTPAPPGTSTG
jgi:hypothetical protein